MNATARRSPSIPAREAMHRGFRYVTRFAVETDFLARYGREVVGAAVHAELWVPAEELDEFNAHLVGLIEVTARFGP